MNKTEKKDVISTLQSEWAEIQTAFLVDFRGLTVPQSSSLRAQVRGSGAKYVVVKNTLARLALADTPLSDLTSFFGGPTAVAYTDEDPVALAKVLVDFAKDNPDTITMKAGMVEGQEIPAEEIQAVAAMPSRPELEAQLVGILSSPMRRLAVALNAPASQFVNVLNQICEQKEKAA